MGERFKSVFFVIYIFLCIIIDQISKFIIRNTLPNTSPIRILPFLTLRYVENTGIVFGWLENKNTTLIIIISVVILCLLFFRKKIAVNKSDEFFLSLIIGGAFGNLLDRISFGKVIDFIDFKYWWTVFNLADIFITFGVLGVVLSKIKFRKCFQR